MTFTPLDAFASVVAFFTGQRRGFDTLAIQASGSRVFMPSNSHYDRHHLKWQTDSP
jgi:hypothetical protein